MIHNTEKLAARQQPGFSIETISLEDPAVFRLFSRGETEGVFQFESAGMRRVVMSLKPEYLEDLIAVIALYRPGPMKFISTYVENRHHPEKVTYRHPRLAKILDVTYGCIVYQEQVMQIFRELAGYSLGRADVVRRAMSKKKADVMERERQIFIQGLRREDGTWEVEGCVNRGVPREVAEEIFREMESFASYAFNKSTRRLMPWWPIRRPGSSATIPGSIWLPSSPACWNPPARWRSISRNVPGCTSRCCRPMSTRAAGDSPWWGKRPSALDCWR